MPALGREEGGRAALDPSHRAARGGPSCPVLTGPCVHVGAQGERRSRGSQDLRSDSGRRGRGRDIGSRWLRGRALG